MRRLTILALGIALGAASSVRAHEVRPGYLELRQTTPERYEVLWKQPAQGTMILRLEPVFPDVCSLVGRGPEELVPGALLTRTLIQCDSNPRPSGSKPDPGASNDAYLRSRPCEQRQVAAQSGNGDGSRLYAAPPVRLRPKERVRLPRVLNRPRAANQPND